MLTFQIVAHTARASQALRLAENLGAQIHWDDGSLGEWGNHRRALETAALSDATHAVILQDDALPVPGFASHVEVAIKQFPDNPISFYLGTSRPPNWQRFLRYAVIEADETNASWLSCSELLHGVAIALPVKDIRELLRWASTLDLPYDERLGAWYRLQGRQVMYTWPSLVDHADENTLIAHADGQTREAPRKAWRVGTPTYSDAAPVLIG